MRPNRSALVATAKIGHAADPARINDGTHSGDARICDALLTHVGVTS